MPSFLVSPEENHTSLRLFIKNKQPDLSGKKIEQLLSRNGCEINGKTERFGSRKLFLGDQVKVHAHFLTTNALKVNPIKILFEDDYLIIIDKPSGLASNPELIKKELKKKVFLAHRLDKMTSGVLILAKSQEALEQMEQLFFKREISKTYIALTHGRVSQSEGEIKDPICLKRRFEGGVQYQTARYGKKAHTLYKRLALSKNESALLLQPITGRTHQLRVHLSSMGHPILGDPLYTETKASALVTSRLLLHAYKIAFKHPFTGKEIAFIAPIPIMFDQIIKKVFKKFKLCEF